MPPSVALRKDAHDALKAASCANSEAEVRRLIADFSCNPRPVRSELVEKAKRQTAAGGLVAGADGMTPARRLVARRYLAAPGPAVSRFLPDVPGAWTWRAARVSTRSGQRAVRASCCAVLPCTRRPIGP